MKIVHTDIMPLNKDFHSLPGPGNNVFAGIESEGKSTVKLSREKKKGNGDLISLLPTLSITKNKFWLWIYYKHFQKNIYRIFRRVR